MDNPSDEIFQARNEGFLTRTRINTVEDSSEERYKKTLETGTNIISFDKEFVYSWSLLENSERCEILDGKSFGKVCRWKQDNWYNVAPMTVS